MSDNSLKKTFIIGFLSGFGAAAILVCICFILWANEPISNLPTNTPTLPDNFDQSSSASVSVSLPSSSEPSSSNMPPQASSSVPSSSNMPQASSSETESKAAIASFPGEYAKLRDSDLLNTLDDEHLTLIYNYFDEYYQSLATLRAKDMTYLFSPHTDDEYENMILNQYTLQILCGIRSERKNDLSIDNYEYGLTITAIEKQHDGSVIIDLLEDNCLEFAFLDGIKSYTSGIDHRFVLIKKDNKWLIMSHDRNEDLFLRVKDQYYNMRGNKPLANRDTVDESFLCIYDTALDAAVSDEKNRIDQLEQYLQNPKQASVNGYDYKYSYNRDAAVQYSYTWVDPTTVIRNEEWQVYDGNCNNYISQCLFAGGIPMDCSGSSQWKWCGDAINYSLNLIGRSPSWAGVLDFYQYCKYNEYGGPVAQVDANLFSAKPGDILQFGAFGNWYHSAIITETAEGDDGSPIDFLINSNTSDHINYPASAYPYSAMRLIRILGHN